MKLKVFLGRAANGELTGRLVNQIGPGQVQTLYACQIAQETAGDHRLALLSALRREAIGTWEIAPADFGAAWNALEVR